MSRRRVVLSVLLLMVAVAGGLWVVQGRGNGPVGPWGLIGVLPAAYWLCLLIPSAVFLRELSRERDPWLLSLALLAQVMLLHGAVAVAESLPRFSTAWLHAGFTNQIMVSGQLTPSIDARFSWPGFFSGAAAFSAAVGVEPVALLRWAPTVLVLAYLPPLALLARSLSRSAAVMWTTLWVFLVADWIGQAYFAPQSLAFLLFLIAIAITCRVFLGRPGDSADRPPGAVRPLGLSRLHGLIGRWTASAPGGNPIQGPRQRAALLTLLVLIVVALAMSHPLTPFMLTAVFVALALVGALRPRLLAVIGFTATLGWVSFAASEYWTGHLRTMFGGGDAVNSGVDARLVGSDTHQYVIYVRMAFALAVWILAAAGALYALRKRQLSLPVLALAGTPFSMLAVQSYGGEGVLRVYLFALPGMALLAAGALVRFVRTRPRRMAAVYVVMVAMLPVFVVARYGNENFERVTVGEYQAVQALYAAAPAGSSLVSIAPNVPWRYQGLTGYTYLPGSRDEFVLDRLDAVIDVMARNPVGSFLIITRGQTAYAEETYNLPAGWSTVLEREIHASGRFETIHRNSDGVVYKVVPTREVDDASK